MGYIYRNRRKQPDGTYKEDSIWWIKYYRNGRCYRESSESDSKMDAKRKLAIREGDIGKGLPVTPQNGRLLFADLLEDLMNDYRLNNGSVSTKYMDMRIRKHIAPVFGHRRAGDISTADIKSFTNARKQAGAANGTINRDLSAVKRAFSLALQCGKLMFAPHVPKLEEAPPRKGFFEPGMFRSLMMGLPDYLQLLVQFAYITGWRRSEIFNLEWRNVDFDAGEVRLDAGTTKNGEGRVFPFISRLRDLLEEQRTLTEALQKNQSRIIVWVFHRDGEQIRDLRGAWVHGKPLAAKPASLVESFTTSGGQRSGILLEPEYRNV